jgi:hypothetical protein
MAGGLELVEPPQGNEDGLANAALVAGVLHDLEILSGPGLLDAEEHGDLRMRDTTILPLDVINIKRELQ